MTPGARVAAAIAILDQVAQGTPAEQALTSWARASRFAGSGDRAAVRDHVYDALRHWRSDAVRGGAETGRARMIGRLRAEGRDPGTLFTGEGHAPAALSAQEASAGGQPETPGDIFDLPDWLVPRFEAALGADWCDAAQGLQVRAPVSVRVNLARTTPPEAIAALARDQITAAPNARAQTALTVTQGARKLRNSTAFAGGLIEMQDASSQAATALITGTGEVLDYCAGGGGKSLALAAQGWRVTAHDSDPARMRDLPARARRGGHDIAVVAQPKGAFDAVLCDVPCSGAGTWRRTPEAKWRLTPERLDALISLQATILDAACAHVAPGGALFYATCSVLNAENSAQIADFCARHPDWHCGDMWSWPIDALGDGFFLARLERQD